MRVQRDPLLVPVSIKSLRPTQITVGLREVKAKREQWLAMGDDRPSFLGRHMIPVVIGPRRRPFIIDHHHLARALHDEGQDEVLITVVADLHELKEEHFWRFLDNSGWLHPFNADGDRRPYADIPRKVSKLRDDPFRSLAGAVREMGGYAKESRPFTEFIWADFFRPHFKGRDINKDWHQVVAHALALARDHKARAMPGWCGPN